MEEGRKVKWEEVGEDGDGLGAGAGDDNDNDNEGNEVKVVGEVDRLFDVDSKEEEEVVEVVKEEVEEVEERMFFGEFLAITASSITYRRLISFSIFVSSLSCNEILYK